MKIGELAQASSTATETIRFYEKEGLLPLPERTPSNYRMYDSSHLERLQLIRYCRSLDMSLEEIRVLLRVKDEPSAACGDVNAVLDEHIGHVSRRITELKFLEKQLQELRRRCGNEQTAAQCGILEGLAQAAQEPNSGSGDERHLRSVHEH